MICLVCKTSWLRVCMCLYVCNIITKYSKVVYSGRHAHFFLSLSDHKTPSAKSWDHRFPWIWPSGTCFGQMNAVALVVSPKRQRGWLLSHSLVINCHVKRFMVDDQMGECGGKTTEREKETERGSTSPPDNQVSSCKMADM